MLELEEEEEEEDYMHFFTINRYSFSQFKRFPMLV